MSKWVLTVCARPHTGGVSILLKSEAVTIAEFMRGLHYNGYCCVQEVEGEVVENPMLKVTVIKVREVKSGSLEG